MTVGLLLVALASAFPAVAAAQAPERIADIRVHGNHTTPDADILAIAGLSVGEPATAERLVEADAKLRASNRFADVQVLRRFQSIADSSQILVILLVEELPGVGKDDVIPGPLARLRVATMWFPILGFEDGYGFTYGARVTVIDKLGSRSRISTPLTWGGVRGAAVEVERALERGPFTVVRGSAAVRRQVNPHFNVPDTRREAQFTADRSLTSWLRVGADARVAQITFGASDARHQAAGGHVVIDTRRDPSFPRNAVLASVAWERVGFEEGAAGRWSTDLRGYVGVAGSTVLALRGRTIRAGAALPASEQTVIGGSESLRGYRAGHRAGDNITATSAELRIPLTSPLSVGRFGAKVFVDVASTSTAATPFAKQQFERGAGAGVYFGVAALTTGLDVAWPRLRHGDGGHAREGARWHFGLGVKF